MAKISLRNYQSDAVAKMKNGCILCGGVGSGKSRTALAYYYKEQGGDINKDVIKLKNPKPLYIITTAQKRDKKEWQDEVVPFLINPNEVIVDSWNNIKKYVSVSESFFILDEQRLVGSGAWVKAFYKIAKKNDWILLSATPGDKWLDYVPVFVANGFYKNKTEFQNEHVIWNRFTKFPSIKGYIGTNRLNRYRRQILVDMNFKRDTVSHHNDVIVDYDVLAFRNLEKTRWNVYEKRPIQNAAELCYLQRKLVNSDVSRAEWIEKFASHHNRIIVFYNFDYELEILRSINYGENFVISEWNGHKHEPIPDTSRWIYLVQYTAGCEGWNCIKTNVMIFYSQNYSYKVMEQARGRIDRMNTPYKDLYYYHLKSRAPIDLAISRALCAKKKFNESKYANWE